MSSSPALPTFNEAIARARTSGKPVSVLLGNGASIDYDHDSFSYNSLWEEARFRGLTISKSELADAVGSTDFETVLRRLKRSARLNELYGADPGLCVQFTADARCVQDALAEAVAKLHPDTALELGDSEVQASTAFLGNFDEVFTTNYDLLLYWATVQGYRERDLNTTDGFFRLSDGTIGWSTEHQQSVHYLHGALHLFVDSDELEKVVSSRAGNIISQVRRRLRNGQRPLIVTEGSSSDKLERIAENEYLSHSFAKFGALNGTLFIHGSSIDKNDDHLFGLLTSKSNCVETLCVSMRPGSANAQRLRERTFDLAQRRKNAGGSQLNIEFYDAASAHLWR
ncbi:DUF4917 family protein [Leucobacter sp. NPDC015123]|uniref:DUF4917 family protein n=1 Tax=Leucobacter sp. NPDC015123 TaxID=3364129 RepID=UPI0036F4658A